MGSIVLVGPPQSGKRTLAAALRSFGDHISVLAPNTINEERLALAQCTAVVFVIGAPDGIDQRTTLLWREISAHGVPRIIAVTKVDDPRANIDETLALIHRLFDAHSPAFVTYPVLGDDESVIGVADLLNATITNYASERAVQLDLEPEHHALIADDQALLQALVASADIDTHPSPMCAAVKSGALTPVYFIAQEIGARELAETLNFCFGEATEHASGEWAQPLNLDPAAEANVRVRVPLDYQEDVLAELQRSGVTVMKQHTPGDGTIEWICSGASDGLNQLPITVAGASECTGSVELLAPPRLDEQVTRISK